MITRDTVESLSIHDNSLTNSSAESEEFETRLLTFVRTLALNYRLSRIRRGGTIYSAGDCDNKIYFLEEGSLKISVSTYAGRSCLLDIHRAPALFGEAACAMAERMDMAVARTAVSLRKIPVSDFMEMLRRQDLTATFVAYLAARGAEHQQIITDFVTCSAEERLASALLRIGRRLGRPESGALCMIEPLSCQELSEMVGTTRSRVGYFLGRFRERRLLVQDSKSHFRILESRLTHYLNREPQKA